MNSRIYTVLLCLSIFTVKLGHGQDTFFGLKAGQVNSLHFFAGDVKPYSSSFQFGADFRIFGRYLGLSATTLNFEKSYPDGSTIKTSNSVLYKINIGRTYQVFKEQRLQYITVSPFFSASNQAELIKTQANGEVQDRYFNYFLVGFDAGYQVYLMDKLAIELGLSYSFPTFPVFQNFGDLNSRFRSAHFSISFYYRLFNLKKNQNETP